MDKINSLLMQLRQYIQNNWAVVAIEALQHPAMKFAGSADTLAESSVSDLIRIYEIRYAYCADRGSFPVGLKELLGILKTRTPNEHIAIEPFISPTHAVTAFFDLKHNLLICVTVPSKEYKNEQ